MLTWAEDLSEITSLPRGGRGKVCVHTLGMLLLGEENGVQFQSLLDVCICISFAIVKGLIFSSESIFSWCRGFYMYFVIVKGMIFSAVSNFLMFEFVYILPWLVEFQGFLSIRWENIILIQ